MKQLLYFIFILLAFSTSLKAQIIVDANLSEWGDYKNMKFDKENTLYYAFKKDNQFLYLSIFKKEKAFKYQGGGIQIFFSQKQKDTTGLQLLFANKLKDPVTKENLKFTHDYFTVKNLNPNSIQQLTTNNETGILLEWNVTNIDYLVVKDGVVDGKATPPNPNIFTAEIQIPLEYLQKYKTGETIGFGIAMRGVNYSLNPTILSQMRQSPMNTQNNDSMDFLDKLTPTSFFETIDLKSVPVIN